MNCRNVVYLQIQIQIQNIFRKCIWMHENPTSITKYSEYPFSVLCVKGLMMPEIVIQTLNTCYCLQVLHYHINIQTNI